MLLMITVSGVACLGDLEHVVEEWPEGDSPVGGNCVSPNEPKK